MLVKTMTSDGFNNYQEEEHDEEEFFEETLIDATDFGENDSILLYGYAVRISDLDLIIASGVFLQYDEDTGISEPDWDICLIYENVPDDEFDPANYIYFEQGIEYSAIHNFLRYRESNKEELQ